MEPQSDSDGKDRRLQLGVLLLVVPFFLFVLLLTTWPTLTDGNPQQLVGGWQWLDKIIGTNPEIRILLLVMISGAIGSSIYAANAFGARVGNSNFSSSWIWWYLLRFPTGIGLALLVYLVIRGGLFAGTFANSETAVSTVNPFGFAALAALTGMFSRQAADKLEEIFEGIFRTNPKASAPGQKPVIESVSGVAANADDGGRVVTVKGRNFDKDARVVLDGTDQRTPDSAEAAEIHFTLNPEDVATARTSKLQIANPREKGGSSNPRNLEIT
jgi:hypothetical protein